MKVYIAASAGGDSYPRVTAAIAALRAAGITVTCTWPEIVAMVGSANPRDATAIQRRGWSTQDLNEIDEADCVWFLVPELPATTRGAWFEAGYAYSSHKHLVFSGDTLQSVFCALGYEFATDAAALAHLIELRDRELVARLRPSLAECKAKFESAHGASAPFEGEFGEAFPLPPAPDLAEEIGGGAQSVVTRRGPTTLDDYFDSTDAETKP